MTNEKNGLVLGGGGSRGSYEVGVCKALNEQNKTFDIVTGTSIGAICGAIYLQGNIENLTEWIDTFQQQDVATNLFIFPNQYTITPLAGQDVNAFLDIFCKGGPTFNPLKNKLKQVFNYDAFMNSSADYACQSYNVTKSQSAVFYKKDMKPDDIIDKLLSSCAYFPAFNLMKIGEDYYVDGGYYMNVPVDIARNMGAQDLTVVDLSNPGDPGNVTVDQNMLLIRPILSLKYFLDFKGKDLSLQVAQGYLETLKYLNLAPGYLYTFYQEDWDHMVHLEELCMGILVKEGKVSMIEEFNPVMDRIYQFLLGYVPQPLKNKYSDRFIFGRVMEVMGLIAGVSLYEQIHFKDFVREILKNFQEFNSDPNLFEGTVMYNEMNQKGLKDYLVFFYSALKSYDAHLPEGFHVFEKKFELPYYLAWGWYLLEKFQFIIFL